MIEGIGLSNVSAAQLQHALDITEIVTVQNSFSLLERGSAEVLDLTSRHGISFAPYLPLGWPQPRRAQTLQHPAVQAIAARTAATPTQVVLAWLLGLAPNMLLIPGTSSIEHLRENVGAGEIELLPEERAALSALSG